MKYTHLLIDKAVLFKYRLIKDPLNCEYNTIIGTWLWGNGKSFLVKSEKKDRPIAGSKKADIETGEDLKGA